MHGIKDNKNYILVLFMIELLALTQNSGSDICEYELNCYLVHYNF